jgi:hypothetical protein
MSVRRLASVRFAALGELRRERRCVHPAIGDLGELGIRLDVGEIDGQVVGGIAEAIGAEVARQDTRGPPRRRSRRRRLRTVSMYSGHGQPPDPGGLRHCGL